MNVCTPEQDSYGKLCVTGKRKEIQFRGPQSEKMEWESVKNERVNQEHNREETGRGNAGLTSKKVPPTINKTVCTEFMECEEGNVVTDNSRNLNNPFVHLKSLNKETGVIHPKPVNTPSGNKPCIKISKNVSIDPMECEIDTESTFKEGEVVHGNIGVMKILLPHLKSVRTETGVIDPWLIDEKKFQYAEYIGRGAFGTVYLVTVMETRKFVSKIVSEEKFNETEVSTLLNLKHESVPTLLGFIRRQQGIEILMQFSGINLEQFVESNQYLDDPKIWSIAKQLLDGLFFLSSRGIMHTDLHPRNICINEGKVQIIDYGSAQQIGDVKHCNGWTVFYAAPEFCNCILQTKDKKKFPLSGKCDVFSCALCLQYLLDKCHTLENYYNGFQDKTVGMKKLVEEPNMVVEKMVTRNGSPVMRCLLISLLQGHPCYRLSAEEGLSKMADLEKRCANWYM